MKGGHAFHSIIVKFSGAHIASTKNEAAEKGFFGLDSVKLKRGHIHTCNLGNYRYDVFGLL